MQFQGLAFLEDGWLQDSVWLDWHKSDVLRSVVPIAGTTMVTSDDVWKKAEGRHPAWQALLP
jgi:hypothetical protein